MRVWKVAKIYHGIIDSCDVCVDIVLPRSFSSAVRAARAGFSDFLLAGTRFNSELQTVSALVLLLNTL